jgi:5-methylcytosine-specific restriction protein B
MATNKLKIQHFRANDLVDNGGRQFEMGKSWCQEFFEIDNSVEEITIHLTFKALSQPQQALDNSLIELKLSGVNIRGDRKAYANGENGHSQIKDFFINKLHLTTSNQSDYFALFKTNQTEYNLYYIPKLLYDNFIYLFINGVDVSCQECSPTERGSIYSLLDSYRPYITAIKSKPLLLLAGISGTGKSRIVRELARACWDVNSAEYKAHKPKNFEMVQVKPNWHDSSELIGYVSRIDGVRYVVGPFLKFMVKAIQDPNTPYFLCLDEMNLAPVEQYFAEFLSVVESRKVDKDGNVVTDPLVDYSSTEEYKSLIDQLFCDDAERKAYLTEVGGKRLTIPQNLIVVGTVNMDETTFSFSRKVLDRAMTIEMNEVDLKGGLTNRHENIGKIEFADIIGKAVEGVDVYAAHQAVCDKAIAYLKSINATLDKTPFKVAYRTRNELLLYVVNNLSWKTDDELEDFVIARALDEITCMKILTRIEGDETKVSANFLDNLGNAIKSGLVEIDKDLLQANKSHKGDAYQPISLDKLDEMKERLKSGYTNFWG